MKPLVWLGDSLERLRAFPAEAKQDAGYQLERVQSGRDPRHWKPMPSVGLGAREIRIRTGRAFRVIYVAAFQEAVYVIHAFEKKTPKTAARDLELARSRFRTLVAERRS